MSFNPVWPLWPDTHFLRWTDALNGSKLQMTCSYYDHTFPPTIYLMNPHNNRKKHWTMKIKQLRSALFLIHFQNCPFCLAVSRQISGLLTSGLAGVWMSVGKTKDRLQNAPLMTVNILLSLPLLRSIRDCHAESVDHPRTGFAAPPHKRMKTSDTRCTSCFFIPLSTRRAGFQRASLSSESRSFSSSGLLWPAVGEICWSDGGVPGWLWQR